MKNESNVGKILHEVWGYSMTLNEFYRVVRETPKTVVVEKIGTEGNTVQGYVRPNPESKPWDGKTARLYKRMFHAPTRNGYFTGTVPFHGSTRKVYANE